MIGKYISAFIAGTGTGGTIMGVQKGFQEFDSRVKIIAARRPRCFFHGDLEEIVHIHCFV